MMSMNRKPFFGCSFLITQLALEGGNFFLEVVDLLLFAKAFFAICHGRLFRDLFNLVLSGLVIIGTWYVQT